MNDKEQITKKLEWAKNWREQFLPSFGQYSIQIVLHDIYVRELEDRLKKLETHTI